MLHEQASHAQRDPVPLVGLNAAFPQRLRHHAEHRAAIELLESSLERVHPQGTNGARLDEREQWHCAGQAVVSLSTGMGRER